MIVETSVIVAIARQENDAETFARCIDSSQRLRMSAANFLEASILVDRDRDPVISRRFDELCKVAGMEIIPFDEPQARIAREAYRDFGKGNGHPARLNFGDCFAYALAKVTGEPLLYKGTDFGQTDVKSALD